MRTIIVSGKSIEVDEEGFLVNRSNWSEEVAKAMAKVDGLKLTRDHWKVITFIREYYDEYQTAPSEYVLTKAMRDRLGPGKRNDKYGFGLHPPINMFRAFKYAGLPSHGTINVSGKSIEVDREGFLVNCFDWSEEITKEMARLDNIELTPDHWEIINFLRGYFKEYQIAPAERVLVKAMGKKLGPDKGNLKNLYTLFPVSMTLCPASLTDKGNRKYLYTLFPGGLHEQACRYAALSMPLVEYFPNLRNLRECPTFADLLRKLTPRELEILRHVAKGESNRTIGRALGITDGAVKLRVKSILRKLRVRSRVEAAVLAVEHSLTRKSQEGIEGIGDATH